MYSKNEIKALFNIAIINKKDKKNIQYFNIVAAIDMTYNFNLYIISNIDNQTINIKTANSISFRI